MFIQSNGSKALAAVWVTMLGAVGVGGAGVASAAQPEAPSVTVGYRDLNLSQPADLRVLYARLQRASASVCEPASTLEPARYMVWKRCYQSALDSAVLSVRSPELLALYNTDNGAAYRRG
jgi:UrcA family protein